MKYVNLPLSTTAGHNLTPRSPTRVLLLPELLLVVAGAGENHQLFPKLITKPFAVGFLASIHSQSPPSPPSKSETAGSRGNVLHNQLALPLLLTTHGQTCATLVRGSVEFARLSRMAFRHCVVCSDGSSSSNFCVQTEPRTRSLRSWVRAFLKFCSISTSRTHFDSVLVTSCLWHRGTTQRQTHV